MPVAVSLSNAMTGLCVTPLRETATSTTHVATSFDARPRTITIPPLVRRPGGTLPPIPRLLPPPPPPVRSEPFPPLCVRIPPVNPLVDLSDAAIDGFVEQGLTADDDVALIIDTLRIDDCACPRRP